MASFDLILGLLFWTKLLWVMFPAGFHCDPRHFRVSFVAVVEVGLPNPAGKLATQASSAT